MAFDVELSPARLAQFRKSLLIWYDANRRDLPWRRTRDPYRVWISEIMLQQTRVAAVLPRYERFLAKFPSVEKLAAAKINDVLAEWSGLGYYRRARNLHAAAKMITQKTGNLPNKYESWLELPGIGRYTAAAIASIAFNEAVAVLDGNVERVLRRILRNGDSKSGAWSAAQTLLDPRRPGDFNQAMMELGATICTPVGPECGSCPVVKLCRTQGRDASPARRPRQRKASVAYALRTREGSVLLVRRHSGETLMPGMWELPQTTSNGSQIHFTVRHSITVTDYRVSVVKSTSSHAGAKWVKISQLHRLPLTGLTQKILRKARIIE